MKAFKAFIKPFEAPERSVKISKLIFSLRPELGWEGLNVIISKHSSNLTFMF